MTIEMVEKRKKNINEVVTRELTIHAEKDMEPVTSASIFA